MKQILFTVLLTIPILSNAQLISREFIGSAGEELSSTNIQLNISVGEAVITTLESPNIVLTQGFQQPEVNLGTVDELQLNNEISMYPNPATDELHLKFLSDELSSEQITVRIFDVGGQLVLQEDGQLFPGSSQSFQLNVNSLRTGHYHLLVLTDGQAIARGKFVKR